MKSYFSDSLKLALVTSICCASLFSQDKAHRWKELVLDVSSPNDAIRFLGPPTKDKKAAALETLRPRIWLSDKQKEKNFQVLLYKNVSEYKHVTLGFWDDKLIAIILEKPDAELETDWTDPDDLAEIFGVDFKPWYGKVGRKLPPPSDFIANQPTELNDDEYSYWYDMIAVADKSFIFAMVDNYKYVGGGFGIFDRHRDQKRKRKEINLKGKYPGFVKQRHIVNRALAAS